jgi:hypothetical protein
MGCGVKIFWTSLFTLPESLDQPLHGHSLEVIIERGKAERDSRDGRGFEELRTQNFELRIISFSPSCDSRGTVRGRWRTVSASCVSDE